MNTVSLGCQRFVVVAAMVSLMVEGGRVASVNGVPGKVVEEKLTIEQLLEISHPGLPRGLRRVTVSLLCGNSMALLICGGRLRNTMNLCR